MSPSAPRRLVAADPLTFVSMMWTVVSLLVAGVCSICILQPCWFVNPHTLHSLGLFSYCFTHPTYWGYAAGSTTSSCGFYGGHHLSFNRLPSATWQAVCVLYSAGCALFCACAVLTLPATVCPAPPPCRRRVVKVIAWMQALAVLLLLAALLALPAALASPLARAFCGPDAGAYRGARCSPGWPYLVAATGAALAAFCPLLASYTDLRVCGDPPPAAARLTWDVRGGSVTYVGRSRVEKRVECV